MLPYHVACTIDSDRLYRLADGRYQLISGGDTAPLMVGVDYVLADHALVRLLQDIGLERTRFDDAIIWRRQSDEELRTHRSLLVSHVFSPDQIDDLDLDGNKFLLMTTSGIGETSLFCTPSLRAHLCSTDIDYLEFSEGLSEFAAAT